MELNEHANAIRAPGSTDLVYARALIMHGRVARGYLFLEKQVDHLKALVPYSMHVEAWDRDDPLLDLKPIEIETEAYEGAQLALDRARAQGFNPAECDPYFDKPLPTNRGGDSSKQE